MNVDNVIIDSESKRITIRLQQAGSNPPLYAISEFLHDIRDRLLVYDTDTVYYEIIDQINSCIILTYETGPQKYY